MPFEVSRYEEWPEEQGWERYAPAGSSAQPAAAPYTMSGAAGPATAKSPIIINASPGKPHYVQAKDPAPTPVIHHAQPWDTDARGVYGYPPDNSGGDRYAYDDAYRNDRYADNNAYRSPYPTSDPSISGENRYLKNITTMMITAVTAIAAPAVTLVAVVIGATAKKFGHILSMTLLWEMENTRGLRNSRRFRGTWDHTRGCLLTSTNINIITY
ncbi:hypothetical protein F4821DRAFT_240735 [Hypoxylon rubiginosum]|uniref:Uncharacterized protein n=1 Tax=Hypoxylon rubiginosum TaxID=110542 RepID=A0ACC0CYE5_9PEZI|nr:hypothetical protein F4821DRAFT_240735 [Hypoxylon rubiginosum]